MAWIVWTLEDKEIAENAIEGAAQDLRSNEPMSPTHKQKWLRMLQRELQFLKEEFPDSYILQQDFSDILN